jgi:hypothetical protein
MPVVTAQMYEGRNFDEKLELVKGITDVMVRVTGTSTCAGRFASYLMSGHGTCYAPPSRPAPDERVLPIGAF